MKTVFPQAAAGRLLRLAAFCLVLGATCSCDPLGQNEDIVPQGTENPETPQNDSPNGVIIIEDIVDG